MGKVVEYNLKEDEFDTLSEFLENLGYWAHSYMGMSEGTIDNGKCDRFGDCKKFSVFTNLKDKSPEEESVKLRVYNSDLIKAIESYFENLTPKTL